MSDLSAAELKFLQKLILAEMNYNAKKCLRGEQSTEDFRCECSLCGKPLTMGKDQPRTKYCPHCGAKMEAEQ